MELDVINEVATWQTAKSNDDAFALGLESYKNKHYASALQLFVKAYEQLAELASTPRRALRDVQYFMYKACIMSKNDKSHAIALPVSIVSLESAVSMGKTSHRRAVTAVTFFGRTGLAIHDMRERRRS